MSYKRGGDPDRIAIQSDINGLASQTPNLGDNHINTLQRSSQTDNMGFERQSWDEWFMALARFVATRSRDPSTKVGAVIVRPNKMVVSMGYNDFPRGVSHGPERYADRAYKLRTTVHAEANAIYTAREPLDGYSIYTTLHPCSGHGCAQAIIQSGIKKVFIPATAIPGRWSEDMTHAASLFEEAGVTVFVGDEPHDTGTFSMIAHLERQRAFSIKTFGPGGRTKFVVDHIRKELNEIEADPSDLEEWIDVVLLACDGAWRSGHMPAEIIAALAGKLAKNEARDWPDWRLADPDKAIEHVREDDVSRHAGDALAYSMWAVQNSPVNWRGAQNCAQNCVESSIEAYQRNVRETDVRAMAAAEPDTLARAYLGKGAA